MPRSKLILAVERRFEASHALPSHPGKCRFLHGHSWVVRFFFDGPVDPATGFVCDYGILKNLVDSRIISKVDHAHLGYGNVYLDRVPILYPAVFGEDFYPSSENLVLKFVDLVHEAWSYFPDIPQACSLHSIEIEETCTSRCTWRRDDG